MANIVEIAGLYICKHWAMLINYGHINHICSVLLDQTGHGGLIGRALVSRAGGRRFEPRVASNQ